MEETCLFWFKSEEMTEKKGVLALFPANYFLKKNWSQNNTYTLEVLKVAFGSISSPNLQL